MFSFFDEKCCFSLDETVSRNESYPDLSSGMKNIHAAVILISKFLIIKDTDAA